MCPMILRLFFFFCRVYFWSYSPLVNIYRLHNNMATNDKKRMGRQKQVVIQMSDLGFIHK